MKTKLQIILRLCLGLSLAGFLAGCAAMTPREISAVDPVDYNTVLEKAQNEMLLLNIVRASKRSPMYFTSISQFTGNETYTLGTGSITIPFGRMGAATSAYSLAPTGTFSTTPQVSIAVWDKKDFLAGMYKPLNLGIVQYYWQEGWQPAILLNLFVRTMKIQKKPSKNERQRTSQLSVSGSLDNPESYTPPTDKQNREALAFQQYSTFQGNLRKYSDCELVSEKEKTPIGPKIVLQNYTGNVPKKGLRNELVAKVAELKDIADGAKKAGLILEPTKEHDGYQIYKEETDYYFMRNGNKIAKVVAEDGSIHEPDGERSVDLDTIYVILRSPEEMLYYLGELTRADAKPDGDIATITLPCGKKVPLFIACKAEDIVKINKKIDIQNEKNPKAPQIAEIDPDKPFFAAVGYGQNKIKNPTYVIPRLKSDNDEWGCDADNSMHILSLISLLIDKQKSAAEAPTTTSPVVIP